MSLRAVADLIQDELNARGWSRDRMALAMSDYGIQRMVLEFLLESAGRSEAWAGHG
jgi:hypothetical protein